MESEPRSDTTDEADDYSDTDRRLIGVDLAPSEAALLDCLPAVAHAPTYNRLFSLGISRGAITGGSPFNSLHVEPVCQLPGARFELARDMRDQSGAALAVVIPCRDQFGETIDLAAWLDTGEVLLWRGAAAMLGEDQIDAPQIDGEGLRIFPDIVSWLRAGRAGVVIVDGAKARWTLAERTLLVDDPDFGDHINRLLTLPTPIILVEVPTTERAMS